jgi:hypothetical protein
MKTFKWVGAALVILSATSLNAQDATTSATGAGEPSVELGVRYMPTFSSFDVHTSNGAVYSQFTMSHGVGGLFAYNFNQHVGLQLEGIYLSISQKYRDNDLDRTVKLSYMNFPLLLSLNTGKGNAVNLNAVVGPQFGINVGSEFSSSGGSQTDTVNAVLAAKAGDLGVAYGAGLEFGLGESHAVHLDIGFRGVYGLLDISDKSKSTTTNEYYILDRAHVQSYAGYVGLTYAF